jgi:hypothetical protein
MGFAGFSIFFTLTGLIILRLLQLAGAHLDWVSLVYILFNFAVSKQEAGLFACSEMCDARI